MRGGGGPAVLSSACLRWQVASVVAGWSVLSRDPAKVRGEAVRLGTGAARGWRSGSREAGKSACSKTYHEYLLSALMCCVVECMINECEPQLVHWDF